MPGPLPPVAINVHVSITTIDQNLGEVTGYKITGDPGNPHITKDGKIDLNGAGRADLTFYVTNTTNLELRFPEKGRNAFWINKNHCPKSGSHSGDVTPENPSTLPDWEKRLILKVCDHNKVKGRFYYALCFRGPHDEDIILDPIIENSGQGGPGHKNFALIVGGLAAVALVALTVKYLLD